MNYQLAVVVLLIAVLAPNAVNGLSCLACNETKCTDPECGPGVGKVLGVCGCCDVCARQRGESCGGIWNLGGTCDSGLRCNDVPESQETGICVPIDGCGCNSQRLCKEWQAAYNDWKELNEQWKKCNGNF